MRVENSSDLSLNNNNNNNNLLNQVMCRQSKRSSKRRSSHPKSCSTQTSLTTSSTSSSTDKQTFRSKSHQRKGKDESCQISSIVKTKLLKVKNSAKNINHWTSSLSNGVTHYFKSINSWTSYKPMCYLIELIARCCRPWINPNKAIAGEDRLISRLPYKAITRKNSPNEENYQKINNNNENKNNRNSYNYSTIYLNSILKMYSPLLSLVILISFICRIAEACSSRSTPKPRPPSPTTRPNITFQTYACPEAYAKWYCLNGATCFSVRIGESILYNCECADGYMGQRCEFKDLDGSYLPSREKVLVETASIAGGVAVAILLMVIIIVFYYSYLRHRKEKRTSNWEMEMDKVSRKSFTRLNSLRKSAPKNVPLSYGHQCFGTQEDKRLQPDLECGSDSVPYTFRPVIITSKNCDSNHKRNENKFTIS